MFLVFAGKYAQVTNNPENDGCINAVLLVWSRYAILVNMMWHTVCIWSKESSVVLLALQFMLVFGTPTSQCNIRVQQSSPLTVTPAVKSEL
jgi:hypothetical protein